MIHSSAPTGIFSGTLPKIFWDLQIQWQNASFNRESKKYRFFEFARVGGYPIIFFMLHIYQAKYGGHFWRGVAIEIPTPPPRAAAPNTENHPKQLFSRGSVKKICPPVGCRSIGYFGGICCKNVRRIFLEGGRHRITPHPPSSHPQKVGEMWIFGAQGKKTAPPVRWPVVYLTGEKKQQRVSEKMFWVPKIVYFYLMQ